MRFIKSKNLTISLISVVIFLFLCEAALKIAGFKYFPLDAGFKISQEYKIFKKSEDDKYYVTAPGKQGIFQSQKFSVKKPKSEIKLFILGGSSIHYLNRVEPLKTKLEKELGDNITIRIINLGGLSYGTNRLLLCFQEIIDYEPDIVVLYSGHNEFEEEYVRQAFFKENIFTKINHSLVRHLRTYQLMTMLMNEFLSFNIKKIKEGDHPFFPPDTKVKWNITFDKSLIYHNYRENIIKMIGLAKDHKIKLLISTVAYNRMVPPFARIDNSYELCRNNYEDGEPRQAKACFENALDSDLQPHRATEQSNAIIREISKTYSIPLIDVDAAIVNAAKDKIPGFDLFNDHCHLNSNGNLILIEAFYKKIKEVLNKSDYEENKSGNRN